VRPRRPASSEKTVLKYGEELCSAVDKGIGLNANRN